LYLLEYKIVYDTKMIKMIYKIFKTIFCFKEINICLDYVMVLDSV